MSGKHNPQDVRPEDCPEPGWHQTHHYCPCCSWTNPNAPKSAEGRLAEVKECCEKYLGYANGHYTALAEDILEIVTTS